jgi:hypothetical protein
MRIRKILLPSLRAHPAAFREDDHCSAVDGVKSRFVLPYRMLLHQSECGGVDISHSGVACACSSRRLDPRRLFSRCLHTTLQSLLQ